MRDSEVPRDKKELRSFLGRTIYVSRFVQHFSDIASLLYELLKKRVLFRWTAVEQEVFDGLKEALCEIMYLKPPSVGDPFVLVTDASYRGIKAGMLLIQAGRLVLLEFASKKLTHAEHK